MFSLIASRPSPRVPVAICRRRGQRFGDNFDMLTSASARTVPAPVMDTPPGGFLPLRPFGRPRSWPMCWRDTSGERIDDRLLSLVGSTSHFEPVEIFLHPVKRIITDLIARSHCQHLLTCGLQRALMKFTVL